MSVHLRAMLENERTLCGAPPSEGSQPLLGLLYMATVQRRKVRAARYCEQCLSIYRENREVLCAFNHILTPELMPRLEQ